MSKGKTIERKQIQDVFIRVCRDSGFKMEASAAAIFAAQLIQISPLEVWTAIGSMDTMRKIAQGTHSSTKIG